MKLKHTTGVYKHFSMVHPEITDEQIIKAMIELDMIASPDISEQYNQTISELCGEQDIKPVDFYTFVTGKAKVEPAGLFAFCEMQIIGDGPCPECGGNDYEILDWKDNGNDCRIEFCECLLCGTSFRIG